MATPITVAYGDGVGPEIMEATLAVLREAGAALTLETIEIGQRLYDMDSKTGLLPSALPVLERTRILLKAPVAGETDMVTQFICEQFGLTNAHKTLIGKDAISYCNENFALFEPLHGPMPELRGKNKANPVAMIRCGIAMLQHTGQENTAQKIESALEKTLNDGIHTPDLYQRKISLRKVTTAEFADELASRL